MNTLNNQPHADRTHAPITQFQHLHAEGQLLFLGNTWDVASARALERAGFAAIGTTSYGMAQAVGVSDGEQLTFEQQVTIVKDIVDHVKIPVSADLEAGYASSYADIVDHVLRIADVGAAGINIEDSPKDQTELRDRFEHAQLLSNIRQALDSRGYAGFFINARTDVYLHPTFASDPALRLAEALARTTTYADHGASGIFIPGLSDYEEIAILVAATPLPLNVMSLPSLTELTDLRKLGIRRFSIGNALSDVVIATLEQYAQQLWQQQRTTSLYTT